MDPKFALFRRAYIDRTLGVVVVEAGRGKHFYLPPPEGKTYDADKVLEAVIRRRTVDLLRWEEFPPKRG